MHPAPGVPLLERTIALYNHALTERTAKEIAELSGLDEAWLSRFRRGRIAEPSVVKVQRLHDWLIAAVRV